MARHGSDILDEDSSLCVIRVIIVAIMNKLRCIMTLANIQYTLCPAFLTAHRFLVTLSFTANDPKDIRLTLPAWIPGSYLVRDFAKHIVKIEARTTAGKALFLEKVDKSTWKIEETSERIEIEYQVYAWDLSVRGAHLDDTHGFYNGSSVFLYPIGMEQEACVVDIKAPLDASYAQWQVATRLRALDAPAHGFGRYFADNYDELIDHPVEMGTYRLAPFTACGVEHEIAITGAPDADLKQISSDLKKICETQIRFFGEPAPMQTYLFLVMALPKDSHGGLEHRASCALHCGREQLPMAHHVERSEGYIDFLSLCSHEYFHTWWVKRVKPAVFYPYQLEREQYTDLLWLFEGFTTYYQDIFLERAGLIDKKTYLQLLAETLTRVMRLPGRFWQTAKQSSFDAWIKFYKPDENFMNANVSYYSKGAMIACALDLWLRQETSGKISLDQVVRQLWQQFGVMTAGVTEKGLLEFLSQQVHPHMQAFLQPLLDSTDEISLEALFKSNGINYQLRPAISIQDMGGYVMPLPKIQAKLGIQAQYMLDGLKVLAVYQDTPAEQAGIAAGDILLALNQWRITADWEQQVARYPLGETVTIHLFRRDALHSKTLMLDPLSPNTVGLAIIDPTSH